MSAIGRPPWYNKGLSITCFVLAGILQLCNIGITHGQLLTEFGKNNQTEPFWWMATFIALTMAVTESVVVGTFTTPLALPWMVTIPPKLAAMNPPWIRKLIYGVIVVILIVAVTLAGLAFSYDWETTSRAFGAVKSVPTRRLIVGIFVIAPEALLFFGSWTNLLFKSSVVNLLPVSNQMDRDMEQALNFKEDVEDMRYDGRQAREARRARRK